MATASEENSVSRLSEKDTGMSKTQRELEIMAALQVGRLQELVLQEQIRRRRAYDSLPAQTARAAHGLWRSIITGGWE